MDFQFGTGQSLQFWCLLKEIQFKGQDSALTKKFGKTTAQFSTQQEVTKRFY